ncbi:MAG: helix-turn-helix transcriptional regulator [Lachnospiraceae bacterium]|nr:helix-turn-helix transcriptional regulator [Lachnospiraceae bacterium]
MAELNLKEIGARIRERRNSVGVTQSYVAQKIDVEPSHVCNIECGRAKPSLELIVQIANALDCTVDYFLAGEYKKSTVKKALSEESCYGRITDKLAGCSPDKMERIEKMMDLL